MVRLVVNAVRRNAQNRITVSKHTIQSNTAHFIISLYCYRIKYSVQHRIPFFTYASSACLPACTAATLSCSSATPLETISDHCHGSAIQFAGHHSMAPDTTLGTPSAIPSAHTQQNVSSKLGENITSMAAIVLRNLGHASQGNVISLAPGRLANSWDRASAC